MSFPNAKEFDEEFNKLVAKYKLHAAYFVVHAKDPKQPRLVTYFTGGNALACTLLDAGFGAGKYRLEEMPTNPPTDSQH